MLEADWFEEIDFSRVMQTLREEATGDWYHDPWAWAEYDYLESTQWRSVVARIRKPVAANTVSSLMIPKENFGLRPAIVVDILDRVAYQSIVDSLSERLIGSLAHDVYGWRLIPLNPTPGRYTRNDFQWSGYRSRIGDLANFYHLGLKVDVSNFFASVDPDLLMGLFTKESG